MRKFYVCCLILLVAGALQAQTTFKLDPNQTMLMTGKGVGQDATINPYYGKDCYALVENLSSRPFSVRIQKAGVLIDTLIIAKKESKKIVLLAGQELYLDAYKELSAKVRVDYRPIESN